MSYADADHSAAIADLIAFEGKPIEIDGVKMKAIIERDTTNFEASEFGIDNREESLTASIINTGRIPNAGAQVFYRGGKYKVTTIEEAGEKILNIGFTND